jgi:hypothetical protein
MTLDVAQYHNRTMAMQLKKPCVLDAGVFEQRMRDVHRYTRNWRTSKADHADK